MATPRSDVGLSPWTPIYTELLAQLRDALDDAAQTYEAAADDADVSPADCYDWKAVMRRT